MCCAERQRGLEADGGEEAEDPGQYFVSSFSIGKVFLHTFSLMIFRTLLGVNVLCLRKSEVKRCECHP